MTTTIIAPKVLGPVIKHEGECYELAYLTNEAPDITEAEEFETCEDCASGSSTAPSTAPSSETSSTAPSSAAPSSTSPSSAAPSSTSPSSAAPSSDVASSTESSAASEAPPEACGTPNANPTILVTLTWTDPDVTKNYLGCTWTNGETKEVYSTTYQLNFYSSTFGTFTDFYTIFKGGRETWDRSSGILLLRSFNSIKLGQSSMINNSSIDAANYIKLNPLTAVKADKVLWYTKSPYTGTDIQYNDFGAVTAGPKPTIGDYRISNNFFTQHTDTNGVTIAWTRGNGW